MLKYVKGSAEVLSMNFEWVSPGEGEEKCPVVFAFYKIACTGDTFEGLNYFLLPATNICHFTPGKLTPELAQKELYDLNLFVFKEGEDPGERFGLDSTQDFNDDRDELVLARMAVTKGFEQFAK